MKTHNGHLSIQGNEHGSHGTTISGMAFLGSPYYMADLPSCFIARRLETFPERGLIIEATPISLTEISFQGAHALMGISSNFFNRLAKDRDSLPNRGRRGNLVEGGQGSNPQSTFSVQNIGQLLDRLKIDNLLGLNDSVLHVDEKVGAPCKENRSFGVRGESYGCLLQSFRFQIFKQRKTHL
jgi:hypothetical protein